MKDVMLDLETFGTRPGCVIRSIGAVMFSPEGEGAGAEFYINVDRASCEAVGLHVDPATESWWKKQNPAAQAALLVDPQPLVVALESFTAWWRMNGGVRIWSHGANFDGPLLEACYHEALRQKAPWKFWDARCTRTVYDVAGVDPTKSIVRQGVAHNAVDDARYQALCVQAAVRRLRGNPDPVAPKPGVFA